MTLWFYETVNKKIPLILWINKQDAVVKNLIRAKLRRMELGNLGNSKSLGAGLYEVKLDVGAGYRLYYSMVGRNIVLLLCAGVKRTQQKDIEVALRYLEDYKIRRKMHGSL